MKSKLFMILVVLVMLVTVVGLGCLGGDDKNATNNTTPENNTTVPPEAENSTPSTPPENNTPEQPPVGSSGSVTVVQGDNGPEPVAFIRTGGRRFSTSAVTISNGETIRIMNTEEMTFRHLIHSEEGAFEDFILDRNYSSRLTFNQPGTYRIELLKTNGEPFGDPVQVLTVTVT